MNQEPPKLYFFYFSYTAGKHSNVHGTNMVYQPTKEFDVAHWCSVLSDKYKSIAIINFWNEVSKDQFLKYLALTSKVKEGKLIPMPHLKLVKPVVT